jgi:hypothetical protein
MSSQAYNFSLLIILPARGGGRDRPPAPGPVRARAAHHRVGEVALDVRHRLALDLEPVSHPHLAHDLVERHLPQIKMNIIIITNNASVAINGPVGRAASAC